MHAGRSLLLCGLFAVLLPVGSAGAKESLPSLLEKAKARIAAGDLAEAGRLLATARGAAGRDLEARVAVTFLEATLDAYRGDYEAATAALIDRLPEVEARPDLPHAFHFHNALTMLRGAQGDLPGALLECYQMRTAGEQGSWTMPGRARMTQVMLKDHWHRAYLLRMLAEQLSGHRRKAALRYAEAARASYGKLARKVGGFDDSIAVLEVLFAVHDGKKKAALAAARRVSAENEDVEDLYLAHMGFDFGGDAAGAAAVYKRMKEVGYVSYANAIMLGWIERDRQAGTGKPRFSPRHPTGRP